VEPGETDVSAVARELLEETGLVVRTGSLVGSVQRPAPSGVYSIFDYAAEVTGGQLRAGDDASAAAWVDLATFETLTSDNQLVPELADTLKKWQSLPHS
jgi:ADP-ribose pyrophosphatase YjhB (NUDIX family)